MADVPERVSSHRARGRVEGATPRRRPGLFARFAHQAATRMGSPFAFALAATLVLAWAVSGPIFGFSATWQLVINTGTTIVTFLMVFLIQSTQNRDSRAMHLKLDAIIDAFDQVREDMVDIESASDEDLDALQREFEAQREHAEHSV